MIKHLMLQNGKQQSISSNNIAHSGDYFIPLMSNVVIAKLVFTQCLYRKSLS